MLDGSLSNDADGDTLSYFWDFGDGTTGTGQKTAHAYAKPGKYRISLLVDDNSGALCSKASDTFEAVVNEKPVSVIKVR